MKYYLMKNHNEIKHIKDLKPCCTTDFTENAEIIATFDDLDEARKAIATYHTEICRVSGYGYNNRFFVVTEYYIQEEDNYGDYWEFSKPAIEVYLYNQMTEEKKTLGIFESYNDAAKFKRDYEYNNDIDDDVFVEIDVDEM